MKIKEQSKRVVVAVSGGFDPIHVGHTRLLEESKNLGNELVVILNNDNWLMKKKGFVFIPQQERKEILESIKWVDRVIFTKHDPDPKDMSVCRELRELKPDIFTNGGDRLKDNIPIAEVAVCEEINCKAIFGIGRGGKVQSSSWLLNKFLENAKKRSREIICPICQNREGPKLIRDFKNKDCLFSLYECSNCGLQFWSPFKNPGKEWYEKEYDYKAKNILASNVYTGCHKRFLKNFKNISSGIKILDIGCGIGEFLAEIQKRGAEVWGVDFNKNHTKIAENKFGLKNIYTMDFSEFFSKKDLPQFDMITFFGLLEHIDNPLELVQNVKKILKPGGVIVASATSKDNLVSGRGCLDVPPHHLSQWSPRSISNLFGKIGFNIFHLEYLDQFNSFKSVATEKFRFGLVGKTAETLNAGALSKQSSARLLKIIRLLGDIKDYLIGGLPASFLWIISVLTRRKGATIFVILK